MRKFILILLLSLFPLQGFATTTLYVDTDASSPTHPTYSSLSAAITYLQGYNGGVLDDDFVIECSGVSADTTAVSISGVTTTATFDLTIFGEGIGATGWSDNKYRLITSTTNSIHIDGVSNITIHDLQVRQTVAGQVEAVYAGTESINLTAYNLYVENMTNNNYVGCIRNFDLVYNCIGVAIGTGGSPFYGNGTTYNCVGVNGYIPFFSNANVYNCISIGGSHSSLSIYDYTTADYNIADHGSVAGANSINNGVATDIFTDPANDDYTIKDAISAAYQTGADLSAHFTTDIAGVTRTVPWDIGAFAYATATSSPFNFYNGSSWIEATPYLYNGTAWEAVTGKRYNGTAWE